MLLHLKVKLLTTDTVKKDKYLKQRPPLRGIVTIRGAHNHNKACTVSQYYRPGEDLKDTFMQYFHDNMGPAAALREHEARILCEKGGRKKLADGHYVPLESSVYYWHKQWRLVNFGPTLHPMDTLREKIQLYNDQGKNSCYIN